MPTTPPNNPNDLETAWAESRTRNNPIPHHLEPGFHLNVPFEDYIRIDGVNFSSLRNAKYSLAHYRYAPASDGDADHFRFGSYIHCGKLEPDELDKRYVVLPDKQFVEHVQNSRTAIGEAPYASPKSTKAYKELVSNFMLAHPDKHEVSTEWYENMRGMLRSLSVNPACISLFKQGAPEVTLVARHPATGLLLKARCDWLHGPLNQPEAVVDLKSTEDPFSWSPDKFDYHIQAAHYLTCLSILLGHKLTTTAITTAFKFWFLVMEKRQPWTVLAAPLSLAALQVGLREHDFLLRAIARAIDTQSYPRANHVPRWELSRWYIPMSFPLAQQPLPGPEPAKPTKPAPKRRRRRTA